MDKRLFDICYEILSHYLHFPEVEDTIKSISDGLDHWKNYPQNDLDFLMKKGSIISYIQKARCGNIIYRCQEGQRILPPIMPGIPYKSLFQDDRNELCIQLENELVVLSLKGIHQIIKRLHPELDDNSLSEELLRLGENTIQKYGLQ